MATIAPQAIQKRGHVIWPCYLRFEDNTEWPTCAYTKGIYLVLGGVRSNMGIRKPRWVILKKAEDGLLYDYCTLCYSYCVYEHVISDRHWKAVSKHPQLCAPPMPPPSFPPAPRLAPPPPPSYGPPWYDVASDDAECLWL